MTSGAVSAFLVLQRIHELMRQSMEVLISHDFPTSSSSAALWGSAALPSGTDPRTGQRAPTQEPALLKGETCFCPGVLSSSCPGLPVLGLSWFRVAGSPVLSRRVPVWLLSSSCFFPLAVGVTFQLPAGGTSGQAQGHRPKKRAFRGIPPYAVFF